jgi:CRP/FNR family cyclic AMP-dependent transcriptional regulator
MSDPIVDILATVPLFSGLDKKQRERLARDFNERAIPAGTVVVRQGDEHGMGFFIVAEGELIASVDGTEVATIGPGSYFGEIALISDRVRTATVTAKTDVKLLVMMLTDFRAFVRGDAEVAWKLLEHVGMLLHHPG